MFLPENVNKSKAADLEKKDACKRLEDWAWHLLPTAFRSENVLIVSVSEVECNDPECSPVDTAVVFLFEGGGQGMFTIGSMAKDVKQDFFRDNFPTPEVLEKWQRGEEADWPPLENEEDQQGYRPPQDFPHLRFVVGMKVLCRVGPMEWHPGIIVSLWHREKHWPEDSFAPYRVTLDNKQDIFAPVDTDQVIRRWSGPIHDYYRYDGDQQQGRGKLLLDPLRVAQPSHRDPKI